MRLRETPTYEDSCFGSLRRPRETPHTIKVASGVSKDFGRCQNIIKIVSEGFENLRNMSKLAKTDSGHLGEPTNNILEACRMEALDLSKKLDTLRMGYSKSDTKSHSKRHANHLDDDASQVESRVSVYGNIRDHTSIYIYI